MVTMQTVKFNQIMEEAGNSVFSVEKIWKDPDVVSEKFVTYLLPDSESINSKINPVFSFQLDNFNLRYFNVLSLRDGVYPLLRFFFRNQIPHSADSALVIDSQLASLVPKAWREKVFLRELYVERPLFEKKREECLILISPEKDSLPLELFNKELAHYKTQLSSFKKISLYFSSCMAKGENEAIYSTNWGYFLLKEFMQTFPQIEIEILDLNRYQSKEASSIVFHQINPLKFYFSDSYLVHDLLQRGALPLNHKNSDRADAHYEKISMNHGFKIISWEGKEESLFEKSLEFFNYQDVNVPIQDSDYVHVKLSTPGFKDFSTDVAFKIKNFFS